MAWPYYAATTGDAGAAAVLQSAASASGLDVSGLSPIGQLQLVGANLLRSDPTTVSVPAGDVSSGTFGANIPDTGAYVFPSSITVNTNIAFKGNVASSTAIATPSAFVAGTFAAFYSAVSGASVMGFGSTNDVTLMNRAGTAIIGITANTTGVTMAGALAITGALSGVTTLAASGLVTLSAAAQSIAATGTAATALIVLAGTGTTTAQQSLTLANTSGALTLGIESSVGATLLAGTAAYGAVLSTTTANQPLYLGTNNVIRLTIAAAGGATFAGALAITGALSGVTTLDNTGKFTTTAAAATATQHLITGTTTSASSYRFTNTTGDTIVGTESSAGGALVASTAAYSTILATTGNLSLYLATNNVIRLTVTGAGVATFSGTLGVTGLITATGGLVSPSPTVGIGYSTGAGGAQTQGAGSGKGTTVVSNTVTTDITMNNAALNLLTIVSFTFTNSAIAATDRVSVDHVSAGTMGCYQAWCTPGAGTSTIFVKNISAGSLSEAIVLKVVVFKSVTS